MCPRALEILNLLEKPKLEPKITLKKRKKILSGIKFKDIRYVTDCVLLWHFVFNIVTLNQIHIPNPVLD